MPVLFKVFNDTRSKLSVSLQIHTWPVTITKDTSKLTTCYRLEFIFMTYEDTKECIGILDYLQINIQMASLSEKLDLNEGNLVVL